jgi:hypothetical protein
VTKNIVIGAMLLAIIFLSASLVRIENQRYALSMGMCPASVVGLPPNMACIAKTETRVGWWWHLYYAVTN